MCSLAATSRAIDRVSGKLSCNLKSVSNNVANVQKPKQSSSFLKSFPSQKTSFSRSTYTTKFAKVTEASLNRSYKITLLPGDGIGPEIIKPAVDVLVEIGKQEGSFTRI